MPGAVVVIVGDRFAREANRRADLVPRDLNRGRPPIEQLLRRGNVGDDIVLFVGVIAAENAGHRLKNLHLFRRQFRTGQGRDIVGGGIEQLGQVRRKADLNNGDRAVFGPRQNPAQKRHRVLDLGGLEGKPVLLRGPEGLVHIIAAVVRDAVFDQPDGNRRVAVPRVDHLDEFGRQRVRPGHRHRQQIALPAIHQGMEHRQGEGVVDVASDVGIENHRDRFSRFGPDGIRAEKDHESRQ